jgi:hypothetical protein
MKLKILLLLALNLVINKGSFSQSVNYNFSNNTTISYLLQDIRKITFDLDLMNIIFYDGNIYSYNVSTINYYSFNENSSSLQEIITVSNLFDLQISPNPTSDNIIASFFINDNTPISIIISDVNGRSIIKENNINPVMGTNKYQFDISTITDGACYFQLTNGKISITKKIIKIK